MAKGGMDAESSANGLLVNIKIPLLPIRRHLRVIQRHNADGQSLLWVVYHSTPDIAAAA
jgi:hypothetical protein